MVCGSGGDVGVVMGVFLLPNILDPVAFDRNVLGPVLSNLVALGPIVLGPIVLNRFELFLIRRGGPLQVNVGYSVEELIVGGVEVGVGTVFEDVNGLGLGRL